VADWSFLANHARVLLCTAHDPGVRHRGQDGHHRAHRLRHRHRSHLGRIHAKHNDGRRNRHQIQAHLPLPQTGSREHTIGEILALLTGADDEATA